MLNKEIENGLKEIFKAAVVENDFTGDYDHYGNVIDIKVDYDGETAKFTHVWDSGEEENLGFEVKIMDDVLYIDCTSDIPLESESVENFIKGAKGDYYVFVSQGIEQLTYEDEYREHFLSEDHNGMFFGTGPKSLEAVEEYNKMLKESNAEHEDVIEQFYCNSSEGVIENEFSTNGNFYEIIFDVKGKSITRKKI